ncbi:uncharacterized protein LOC103570676 [Microplitis demolitor]|uniref:uncharacterized protein LOC103570676 n=1 Tax=Microplitis demolitor TaxID=69319 RepID=UPI0004CD97E9|nr:uncharacterized protein LOC103570676 [Microplitis demolitor]XP_014295342.1 uncharacterized protein LOC103570676 [Microplitis demolitor]
MVSKLESSIIRSMFLIICSTSLITNVESIPNPVKKVRSAVNIINDITSLITGMDGLINLFKNDNSDEEFQNKVTEKLDDIYKACLKIDEVKEQIRNLTSVVDANAIRVISEITLREDMNYIFNINNKLNIIGTRYKNDFLSIYPQIKNYRHKSIDTYISSIIDNDDLKDKLTEILKAAKLPDGYDPYGGKNIFEIAVAFSKNEKNNHRECNSISAYDKLYNFYKYIVGTVTQGYTMIIMAYEYRKLKSTDPVFNKNRQLEYLNIYKQAIIQITKSVQFYLNSNNNVDFKSTISCDPKPWKEGENYIRVKNYVSVRSFDTGFTRTGLDRRGIEYECEDSAEYADSAIPELILTKHCLTPFFVNARELSYSESPEFPTRIMERKCVLGYRSLVEERCHYDRNSDPTLSIRKLSLLLQTCKTDINEVVTNARFHDQDGIISIEIQCGTFVDGKVDPDTLRWNTDDRSYTRTNHPNHVVLSGTLKSVNLDDIVLPDGEFVTGMKFEKLNDNHLSLVLQGTEMYDSNNQIISGQTSLRFPQYTGNSRVNIDVNQLITPLEINTQTYEMSQSGVHHINFAITKWSNKYTSNSVIPFLDMQSVNFVPALPLGGLGLFYKSQPGYGGFLAFKHISPKYMHFISDDFADQLAITSPGA